jgi:hypothetical protein
MRAGQGHKRESRDTRTTGKPFLFVVLALLVLSVIDAWGACTTSWEQETIGYTNDPTCSSAEPWRCGFQGGSGEYCGTGNRSYCRPTATRLCECYVTNRNCNPVGQASSLTGGCMTITCNNKCEADSVKNGGFILECQYDVVQHKYYRWICPNDIKCSSCGQQFYSDQTLCQQAYCQDNPQAAGCETEHDTLLYACSMFNDGGTWKAGIYKLNCKTLGGTITSCNGKQDVNIEQDGILTRAYDGTCEQNGFQNGIFGGGTPQDSLPNGASADCFAEIGSNCHMRDKASGNTFTCACDGSCAVALRNLMAGNANCSNPYPQPSSSGTDVNLSSYNAQQSSASSSPSSGGSSEPASSSSGGGEGGGASSDFEYDYTQVLDDIRANTQYTGTQAERLNDKAAQANEWLRQIAGKDWSPSVNVASPNVSVNVQGDTAKAPAEILTLLRDKLGGGEPNSGDTAGMGAQESALLGRLDSLLADSLPNMRDSIGTAVTQYGAAFDAFRDSMENSPWADSVDKWTDALVDNGVITGSGSANCPAVLTRTWDVPLGVTTANVGPLGKYLCASVPAVGVTLWALARVLLRAVVSIACMVWIFKAVLGIDGGNNEED